MLNELNYKVAKFRFGLAKRLDFYRMAQAFLEDGNNVVEAVEESAEYYGRKSLSFMFRRWLSELKNGARLSEVVDGWIPPAEISFIQAGEQQANLNEPLSNLVILLQRQAAASKEILRIFTEPVGYLIMFFAGAFGIAIGVVPEFAEAMPMENVSKFSQWFFAFCEWLAQWGVWVTFWSAIVIVVTLASLPFVTGPFRQWLDRVPPYSIYKRMTSSYFLIALSSMFRSGVGIQEAVQAFAEHASPWMRSHLRVVARRVREGMNEGDSLQTGMMPADMSGEVQRYARLSGFERAFFRIGNTNLERQLDRMRTVAVTARLVSMFGLAALIGSFLFAILGVVTPLLKTNAY